jgi:hypothetical protein
MMYLHFHDGEQFVYLDECPVCAPILAVNPGAVITDAAEGAQIDG